MRTWSLTAVVDDVKAVTKYVASLAFAPLLDSVYPPCGHDVDVVDGAEQLAEREAEEEVGEPADCPTGYYVGDDEWYCEGCNGFFDNEAEFAAHRYPDDDTPNPTEPGLSDDELVAVRGLIQERYETDCTCPSWGNPSWPHRNGCPAAPRDDLAARLARINAAHDVPVPPAGSGGEEVCDRIPHGSPSSPRPAWSDLADAVVNHKPAAKAADADYWDPADAAAAWFGAAVPVISEVLAVHRPAVDYTGVYCNTNSDDGPHDYYENWAAWHAHVAPLIAEALVTQHK